MSWTDDIRCLYCDGKLPLYRKITNGQFCSTAHRKAYWQEQENLAVERLHQTHNSLRAYRPPGAVEAILGRPEAQPQPIDPDPAGAIPQTLLAKPGRSPEIAAADPIAYEMGPRPFVLFELEAEGLRELAPAGSLPTFAVMAAYAGAGAAPIANTFAPESFETRGVVRPPDFPDLTVETEELAEPAGDPIPGLASRLPIPGPSARNHIADGMRPVAIATTMAHRLPPDTPANPSMPQFELAAGQLLGLSLTSIPLVQGTWIDDLGPVGLDRDSKASPPMAWTAVSLLTSQAGTPAPRLAAGRRYAIAVRPPAALLRTAEPVIFSPATLRISLPERKPLPVATPERSGNSPSATPRIAVPNPGGLVSMSPTGKNAKAETIPTPQPALLIPQPPRTEPTVPVSKLEPLDAKPIADLLSPPVTESVPEAPTAPAPKTDQPAPPMPLSQIPEPQLRKTYPWMPAVDFLRNAPRDLKMLVFAIPVLLGLALHPSLPKVKVSAPASTAGIERNVQQAVTTQLVTFKQSMLDRAAVALDEDFRSGLDEWVSRDDATAEWSFDATGFVQPGPLALYRPSLGLTDYQLQFLGMIDKRALSWVVRAADFQNYYVIKLVVLKPGPLPTIGVTRYAVINGKPDTRVDSIAPVDARADMLYRVRLDVHGDMFVLVVQGQVVDSWSEPRLKHGGVGFFSARGEGSRVRWVQVTHQYDMLGRLCAYLAPYNNSSSSNGSFQP